MDIINSSKKRNSWKLKYSDLIDSARKKENQWKKAEKLLISSVTILANYANSSDKQLNSMLTSLQDLGRINPNSKKIYKILNELSQVPPVQNTEKNKRSDHQITKLPLQLIDDLIVLLPEQLKTRAKDLYNQFKNSNKGKVNDKLYDDLIGLFYNAFINKQQNNGKASPGIDQENNYSLLREDSNQTPIKIRTRAIGNAINNNSDQYLVKSILQSFVNDHCLNDCDETLVSDIQNSIANAVTDNDLLDITNRIIQLESLNKSGSETTTAEPIGSLWDNVNFMFIQFIDNLTIPHVLREDADSLRERLLDTSMQDNHATSLRAVVSFILRMQHAFTEEKEELQLFLKKLNERLQELDRNLWDTHLHRDSTVSSGIEFSKTVQQEVIGIEASVSVAKDIDSLKVNIQNKLEGLRSHIQEYQLKEQEEQFKLKGEVKLLKQKLDNIEEETDKLRDRLKKEREQSLIDALTGVHNRLAFEERFKLEYARWKRYSQPLALIIIDIDHFKSVNDRFGHKAGDKALKYVAKVLEKSVREADFLARYGGEEFVVLLPETNGDSLMTVAEKLRIAVEKSKFQFSNNNVKITISCGLACFENSDTPEVVFKRADSALYLAKKQGRNQCCVNSKDHDLSDILVE